MPKKIYVIAGEVSGDLHGANLIEALKRESKEALEIYGVGGDRIRDTGARDFLDLAHVHATGFVEILQHIPFYLKARKKILESIRHARPNLVIMIDNPGFNLKLAQKIHALNIPLCYYITPQLWAWGRRRVHAIRRLFSKVFVVFEFEKKLFQDHRVPVSWVGHPLKDVLAKNLQFPKPQAQRPTIALMPGSRKAEVGTLLPIFLEAARMLHGTNPETQFLLFKSPSISRDFYARFLKNLELPLRWIEREPYDELQTCHLAIVCSGTVTLECALLGVPMIITNKANLLTYWIVKRLITVPYLGLPNLILNKPAFPELLQYDCTSEKISTAARTILTKKDLWNALRKDLEKVSKSLGEKGGSQRVALEILQHR